jgi:hypothetical protein
LNLSKISSEDVDELLKSVENKCSKELQDLLSDMLLNNITITEIMEYPMIKQISIEFEHGEEDEEVENEELEEEAITETDSSNDEIEKTDGMKDDEVDIQNDETLIKNDELEEEVTTVPDSSNDEIVNAEGIKDDEMDIHNDEPDNEGETEIRKDIIDQTFSLKGTQLQESSDQPKENSIFPNELSDLSKDFYEVVEELSYDGVVDGWLHPSKGTLLKHIKQNKNDGVLGYFVDEHGMEGLYRKNMLIRVVMNPNLGAIIENQINFTVKDVESFLFDYGITRVMQGYFM